IKPRMISLASSANMFAGNELDRAQVQQFVSLLTRVTRTSKGGLILISHPSLAGLSTGTGLSGSTQWHNSVRARFYIKAAENDDEDDAEPRTDARTIEFLKNNYGPVSSSVTVQYRDGVFAPWTQDEAAAAAKREKAKEVFLTILRRFNQQNRHASPNPRRPYAPPQFPEEGGALQDGVSKHAPQRATP